MVDKDKPQTWVKYRDSLCRTCRAECCTMILEVKAQDLVRLGLCSEDEVLSSPKKVLKNLQKNKIATSYRAHSELFTLQSKSNGDCQFLNSTTRLCTVYEKRPEMCRRFPSVGGPRPGFCPAKSANN